LYRKWRPKTFDEVSGQSHITQTLKTQVANGRLSHAYLFTGTRGTGKTSCAKILARAVNCEHPVDGNPCNCCASCRGILDGSVLDVLELDAASNNGVDQVRALRDEAVYAPAAVKKRVYIVDEVHMLSIPAFNALLKILEEPPAHLMFILATTELHKVPATILSRCQRFSFKRILPQEIVERLRYVAEQEHIDLTEEGATLLARLADGGMRDALSLLDQCAVSGGTIDRERVLDTLGLAGNLKTAHILNAIRRGDAAGAITQFGDLYAAGKDVTAVLSELTGLCRDLLIRQTAPEAGMGLMAGGYDEATLKTLSKNLPAERLIAMLELLEQAAEDCKRSGSSRTVAEICLIRLCDPSLDGSNAGLAARIARLEAAVAQGIPVADLQSEKPDQPLQPISNQAQPQNTVQPQPVAVPVATPEVTGPSASAQPPQETKPTKSAAAAADEWTQLVGGMKGKVPMTAYPFLKNTEKVIGRRQGSVLTIYYLDDFAYDQSNKPEVLRAITDSVSAQLGQAIHVDLRKGTPTEETPAPQQQEQPSKPVGSISDLKQFMKQHQS
jgi:DNA polymerase-3 subunit gamma/tau